MGWRRLPYVCGMLAAVLALAGCAGREIPMTDLRIAYGLPSSKTFEPEPGLVVHYTEDGPADGPVILLVHGFGASVHAWRPWIERLETNYRLIAIDLPGHGLTLAPRDYRATRERNTELISKLADHAGAERFVLAGNSMGGTVSLAFAMRRDKRLNALVLVDAAGWPGESGKPRGGPPGAFALLDNGVGRFLLKLFDVKMFVADGLRSAYLDESLATDALIQRYADLAMGEGHRDILLSQRSQPATPWTSADFANISVPVLVIAGEKDKLIPVEDARAIAAAIPGAMLVTYPDGGHLPMEQLPDETVRDLRAFLGRLAPVAPARMDHAPAEAPSASN